MARRRQVTNTEEKKTAKVEVSNESIDDTSCMPKTILKSILVCIAVAYVLIPVAIGVIPQIVEQIVFMNLYCASNEPISLSRPRSEYGLSGTASFRIKCDDVELGVWHVLPESKISEYKEDDVVSPAMVQSRLEDAENIILYHHGNGMSRATGDNNQRPKLYKLLQSAGYHTIAFDYRGFGDSTGWPSESGLVNDSLCILNWVRESVAPNVKVAYWGHSLGSSIATLAAKKAADRCDKASSSCASHKIDSLILEGAFTNIRQGAEDNIIAQLFMTIYPKSVIKQALERALTAKHLDLATDMNIPEVNCPVMLLHAEDDLVIACKHSEELYSVAERMKRKNKRIEFVKFKASHGYGHMDIFKAPELPQLLKDFLLNKEQTGSSRIIVL